MNAAVRRKILIIPAIVLAIVSVAHPAAQVDLAEGYGEKRTNERQPPEKVLATIGLRPGMVVGEVGAGRGRYTVYLAAGVGSAGKVYANDIDADGLGHLRERCLRLGQAHVETVLGRVDDPLFPDGCLDLAFMALTYHHLAKPVELLRNLIPSLKPGATVAIVDPDPVKDGDRGGRESTSVEKMRREAGQAGFELVRVETFLEKDNIFILRIRTESRT